ncbi:hypothetical protein [Kribbella sp. NPDC051137]|uniref:hypothetical protein n=1 Tax=Kribbella sp. NPDC051137 TaxID=3155045 RepID=UPI0034284AEA
MAAFDAPSGEGRGTQAVVTWITLLGGVFFVVFGTWALLWPHNFYEAVAEFPPFNLHLFHDAGAFQLGIGASLLGAVLWPDAVFVALLGGSVAAIIHAASHVIDRDLGGDASGPWSLGALAVVLLTATVLRLRVRR